MAVLSYNRSEVLVEALESKNFVARELGVKSVRIRMGLGRYDQSHQEWAYDL